MKGGYAQIDVDLLLWMERHCENELVKY